MLAIKKQWRCATCAYVLPDDSSLKDTMIPAVRLGRCPRCDHTRAFRPTSEEATEGLALKEAGMAAADGAAGPDWRRRFDAELETLASKRTDFTSEDVTGRVGLPSSSGAVGARMNAAARRGLIERVGYRSARRSNQHAATISIWRGR